MNRELVARFVYEVCTTARLPMVMYGNAMMTYHAFCEYTSVQQEDLLLAATCLLLAVKFGESILNSHACILESKMRPSSAVIDATARVVLWYGRHKSAASSVSVEQMAEVRRFIAKAVGEMELSVIRIVGNYLTSIPSAFSLLAEDDTGERLIKVYASPACLNAPPVNLASQDMK